MAGLGRTAGKLGEIVNFQLTKVRGISEGQGLIPKGIGALTIVQMRAEDEYGTLLLSTGFANLS